MLEAHTEIGAATPPSSLGAQGQALLQKLAAAGDYVGLFKAAKNMGVLEQLTTASGWIGLGLKDPANQQQFQALYAAFKPYEAQMQGKTAVGATGYQGRTNDQVVWGDPSNALTDANANFAAAQRAGSVSSNEAMLAAANKQIAASPTLRQMTNFSPQGGGGGGGPATRAQENLQADAPNLATFMGSDQTALAANRASNIGIAEVVGLAAAGFGGAIAAGAGAADTAAVGTGEAATTTALPTEEVGAATALPEAGTGGGLADAAITAPATEAPAITAPEIAAPTLPTVAAPASGFSLAPVATRAGIGAITSAARGGNPFVGAAAGAVGGAAGEALNVAGVPSLVSNVAGNVVGGATRSALAGGNVNPQIGQPTTPLMATAGQGMPSGGGAGDPSLLDQFISGAEGALPYAAVGAAGTAAASSARNEANSLAQQEINLGKPATDAGKQLITNAMQGKLTPEQQAALTTAEDQGNKLINAADPLNQIAQTAFGNYAKGTLTASDQQTVDEFTQSAQQAWLSSNPNNADSGAKAAAFANIDAQAAQLKQSLLTQEFGVGQSAEAQWLTQTTAGQQTIQNAQRNAINDINTTFTQGLAALGLGMQPAMAGIQQMMQNDAEFGQQVTGLFESLAMAYALQGAKTGMNAITPGSTAGVPGVPGTGGAPAGGPPGPGDPQGSGDPLTSATGSGQNPWDTTAQYAQYPSYSIDAATGFGG